MSDRASFSESSARRTNDDKPKVAIIAGGGKLPGVVTDQCRKKLRPYYVIGLSGHVDDEWLTQHPHTTLTIGQVGKIMKTLRQIGAEEVVFAGDVRRPSWSELSLDLRGMWWLWQFRRRKPSGDDALLRFISNKLEKAGYNVVAADKIADGAMTKKQTVYTKRTPVSREWQDIEDAREVSLTLGALDVGQSVVVQDGLILGVEAIEGTDALIKRCGELKRKGPKPILVKCAKPQQDERLDIPTIGAQTVENVIAAGFDGIAIEGGRSYFLDQDEAIAQADEADIFIVSVPVRPLSDDDDNDNDSDKESV